MSNGAKKQPFIIAIAGGTGSGKTYIAKKLHEVAPDRTVSISQDNYYRDRSDVPKEKRMEINYDEPSAIDNKMFLEHLKQLRNGFLVFKSHIILAMNKGDKSDNDSQIISFADDRRPAQAGSKMGQSFAKGGSASGGENLNAKQKKILEKFSEKNTLKLAEILELFPDVSERTVRNELTSLIGLGKLTRDGRGNGSFYKKTIDS